MRCSLFELNFNSQKSLHFIGTIENDWKKNADFVYHARILVDMIDCVVCSLGGDLDDLAEEMAELGQRHLRYGVQPQDIPSMGEAIIFAMEHLLGNSFTSDDSREWGIVLAFLTDNMMLGMFVD